MWESMVTGPTRDKPSVTLYWLGLQGQIHVSVIVSRLLAIGRKLVVPNPTPHYCSRFSRAASRKTNCASGWNDSRTMPTLGVFSQEGEPRSFRWFPNPVWDPLAHLRPTSEPPYFRATSDRKTNWESGWNDSTIAFRIWKGYLSDPFR
jgi:hypothetical protein